jgi:hypothetical protein
MAVALTYILENLDWLIWIVETQALAILLILGMLM